MNVACGKCGKTFRGVKKKNSHVKWCSVRRGVVPATERTQQQALQPQSQPLNSELAAQQHALCFEDATQPPDHATQPPDHAAQPPDHAHDLPTKRLAEDVNGSPSQSARRCAAKFARITSKFGVCHQFVDAMLDFTREEPDWFQKVCVLCVYMNLFSALPLHMDCVLITGEPTVP